MSRMIKFRVFDSETKEMLSHESCCRQPWNVFGSFNRTDSPYVFMQFTGLLDNNGIEVYEGDVVKFYTGSRGAEGVDSSGFYEVTVEWEHLWWNIMDHDLENGRHGFEVVGNKFDKQHASTGNNIG